MRVWSGAGVNLRWTLMGELMLPSPQFAGREGTPSPFLTHFYRKSAPMIVSIIYGIQHMSVYYTGVCALLASHSSSVSFLTCSSRATFVTPRAARCSVSTLASANCCFRCDIITYTREIILSSSLVISSLYITQFNIMLLLLL